MFFIRLGFERRNGLRCDGMCMLDEFRRHNDGRWNHFGIQLFPGHVWIFQITVTVSEPWSGCIKGVFECVGHIAGRGGVYMVMRIHSHEFARFQCIVFHDFQPIVCHVLTVIPVGGNVFFLLDTFIDDSFRLPGSKIASIFHDGRKIKMNVVGSTVTLLPHCCLFE